METWFTPGMGLAGLFVSAFLAATLLPGGSEVVLFGVLRSHPETLWWALAVATLGNTLGGLTSVFAGRLIPGHPREPEPEPEPEPAPAPGPPGPHTSTLAWARRWGTPILLLSWVPVIGDALCVAAGWLRLPWLPTVAFLAAGKFLRYAVVAFAAEHLF